MLADTVKIGQPEVNLGLIPGFGGTQRLARLVGPGIAKELIMTADAIDAAEALRIGLANKVVPADKLMETVTEMAKKIAAKGPTAVKLAKACINLGHGYRPGHRQFVRNRGVRSLLLHPGTGRRAPGRFWRSGSRTGRKERCRR